MALGHEKRDVYRLSLGYQAGERLGDYGWGEENFESDFEPDPEPDSDPDPDLELEKRKDYSEGGGDVQ